MHEFLGFNGQTLAGGYWFGFTPEYLRISRFTFARLDPLSKKYSPLLGGKVLSAALLSLFASPSSRESLLLIRRDRSGRLRECILVCSEEEGVPQFSSFSLLLVECSRRLAPFSGPDFRFGRTPGRVGRQARPSPLSWSCSQPKREPVKATRAETS